MTPEIINNFNTSTYCLEQGYKSMIKIGANDGVTDEKFLAFMTITKDLKAVFVEPLGYMLERAKEKYKSHKNIVYKNVAIAEEKGELPFYYLGPKLYEAHPDAPKFCAMLGSFNPTHIWSELRGRYSDFIVIEKVPTDTLMAVIEEVDLFDVDILQIDTEGFDYKILRQLDLEKCRPKLIFFEYKHLSPQEKVQALELLSPLYRISALEQDYVCFLK